MRGAFRAELEALRRKGLTGELTEREFRDLRRGREVLPPLRAFLARLRALRRAGGRVPEVPPSALAELDAAIAQVQATLGATDRIARLGGPPGVMLGRLSSGRSIARG